MNSPHNDEVTNSWVEDGTAVSEPVTTETPAEPTTQEPEAVSHETPEAVSGDAVVEGFMGRVGDDDVEIPKGFTVPIRRGDDLEYVPIEDLQSRSMLEKDYRHKSSALNQERRALLAREREMHVRQTQFKARETYLDDREEQLKRSFTDPEAHAAHEEHLRQYEENPVYRKNVDDALSKRESDAQLKGYQEREQSALLEQGVAQVQEWAEELHTAHPDVPVDRALATYGDRLERAGANGRLEKQDLEAIFVAEERYLAGQNAPIKEALANRDAEIERLTANDDATERNRATVHALNRGKVPRVNATTNSPVPHKKTKQKRHSMEEHQGVVDAWARGG